MAISVLAALELDRKSADNRMTLVEENHTSDGSFIVSTFLEQAVKKGKKIILLLFHNSVGHYYSIAQKLGYNLSEYQMKGNMLVYDFLKTIYNGTAENVLANDDVLKDIFLDIRQKVIDLCKSYDVTLVIDNIGNVLLLGFSLKILIFFMHYCQTLLQQQKNFSLVCLVHNFLDNDESRILINTLKHMSYLNIIVDDLKTGKAADISGKFCVKWRTQDLMQWLEQNEYHYQLLDKNVNVFAPGMKYL